MDSIKKGLATVLVETLRDAQGLVRTDVEPRARRRQLDQAAAPLEWPAIGAQRRYFSEDAVFSRPALAQPSMSR